MSSKARDTAAFRALHQQPGTPLVLPNIWDAGSARLVEALGAKALATSSASVAWSLGYPDGDRLPIDLLARRVSEIVDVVNVPVTIDVESGYSDDPATVVENLAAVFAHGVSGINIEDGQDSPDLLAKKIEALKSALAAQGQDVFINARTDVYLANLVDNQQKIAETLRRERLYREAGADGLFVPCIVADVEIRAITNAATLPVNVMAMPGLSKLDALAELGVRRLSTGGQMSQVAWKDIERLAQQFLAEGNSDVLFENALGYGELQRYNAIR